MPLLKIYLSACLLIVCMASTWAQNKPKEKPWTDKELLLFYEIYDYQLSHPFDLLTLLPKHVRKAGLSDARMEAIMQAQNLGYDPQLTPKEERQLKQIQAGMQEEKEAYEQKIQAYIVEKGLEVKVFEEIKKAYLADYALQQKVQRLLTQQKNE